MRNAIDLELRSCDLYWILVETKVHGRTDSVRAKWPEKVMLIGWAAEPKFLRGENPINIVNDLDWPDVECLWHNLVQMMPKDPAVTLCLVRIADHHVRVGLSLSKHLLACQLHPFRTLI